MTAEMISGPGGDADPLPLGALQFTDYLGADPGQWGSACPPEYADVPIRDLIAQVDAEREERAAAAGGENLAAGFWPRTPAGPSRAGSGFESGGMLDVCAPDGSLAGLTDAATRDGRLADLDDDELIGVLRAWRRLESWCSGGLLAAIAELARRRPAERTAPAPPGDFPAQLSEFIGDEVAAALTVSGRAAGGYLDLALDLAARLPGTARALRGGVIDYLKARLIAEATRVLSDDQARAVEARILPAAGQQTLTQLRAAVARAVLAVDPEAAARRREQAQKDPRVRRWQEDAGTAALAGYGLPPAEVLAADQQLTTRALRLREAGLTGSLEELRARAYLDALLGHDSAPQVTPRDPAGPAPSDPAPGDPAHSDPAPGDRTHGGPGPGGPGPSGPAHGSPVPGGPADDAPSAPPRPEPPAAQPRLAGRITLTVPLTTALGLAAGPGTLAGFGPIDPPLARHLLAATAAHPASRLCLTITGQDGRAIGHGCARGQPLQADDLQGRPFTVTIRPLAQGTCDHRHQEPGYQPSRRLRHLIWARTPTCTAPGCRRPAARCDLDHTTPYDQGGRTCECGLAPLCRHHHRCKQSQGWRLEQPSPGVMCWTTPAGRHYVTLPGADP